MCHHYHHRCYHCRVHRRHYRHHHYHHRCYHSLRHRHLQVIHTWIDRTEGGYKCVVIISIIIIIILVIVIFVFVIFVVVIMIRSSGNSFEFA